MKINEGGMKQNSPSAPSQERYCSKRYQITISCRITLFAVLVASNKWKRYRLGPAAEAAPCLRGHTTSRSPTPLLQPHSPRATWSWTSLCLWLFLKSCKHLGTGPISVALAMPSTVLGYHSSFLPDEC